MRCWAYIPTREIVLASGKSAGYGRVCWAKTFRPTFLLLHLFADSFHITSLGDLQLGDLL